MSNQHHYWRIRPVTAVLADCVICLVPPSPRNPHRVCGFYDHDLRGHVCPEHCEMVRNAEERLFDAHLEQPTDSILDGGGL